MRTLAATPQGRAILVVDDEPGVRAVTAGFLSRAGYEVLESASGAEAVETVRNRPDIALVVMDVMMPGMNGGEAAQRIHAERAELPVLFVTGYADLGILPQGVAVLHKPYTRDALLGDVKAMLLHRPTPCSGRNKAYLRKIMHTFHTASSSHDPSAGTGQPFSACGAGPKLLWRAMVRSRWAARLLRQCP